MPRTVGAGSSWKQESRIQLESLLWVMGPQVLCYHLLPPRMHSSRKLKAEWSQDSNPGTVIYSDAGTPNSIFIMGTSIQALKIPLLIWKGIWSICDIMACSSQQDMCCYLSHQKGMGLSLQSQRKGMVKKGHCRLLGFSFQHFTIIKKTAAFQQVGWLASGSECP